jgi:hypothetical protein
MLVGPFVLDIVKSDDITPLNFVNEIALTVIALNAGVELYFPDLRALFRTIAVQMLAISTATLVLVTGVMLALSSHIKFMDDYEFDFSCKLSVSLLFAATMLARSVSSAMVSAFGSKLLAFAVCILLCNIAFIFAVSVNKRNARVTLRGCECKCNPRLMCLLPYCVSLSLSFSGAC